MRFEKLDLSSTVQDLQALEALFNQVKLVSHPLDKLEILNSSPAVKAFLETSNNLRQFLAGLTLECDLAIKSVLAVGQGPIVFNQIDALSHPFGSLREMLQQLSEVEKFYSSLGGIVGYYYLAIKLIAEKKASSKKDVQNRHFYRPEGIELSKETKEVLQAIQKGIENFPKMAALLPLGGAGDRLDLHDASTGEALPAAYLPFGGFSLLEGLVRDLQAKEYLYWQLHQKQLMTPIAMMTSEEKNNEQRILDICVERRWFGRMPALFKWFKQPLVPVILENGDFSLSSPLKLKLKPGGHGAIWKLAQDHEILAWFELQNRSKILVRQINNPVAGTDNGILALIGIGCSSDKTIGIASCQRQLNSAEGMLIMIETPFDGKFRYTLTNIEYTDFQTNGLEDVPAEPGSCYSLYPANTNILFVDIASVKKALSITPVPGVLINLKHKAPYIDIDGNVREAYGGRLEAMMQNISEHMGDCFSQKLDFKSHHVLHSFLTYNTRRKTISVTKNQMTEGKSPLETPEACYFDQLENHYELLACYCQMTLPSKTTFETYLLEGPSFHLNYHPALGPIYYIIGQKIRGGAIAIGAELQLEIAEIDLENLSLEGSLHIEAKEVFGHRDSSGIISYSHQNGKCELFNVRVINRGFNRSADNNFWSNQLIHHEQMAIVLHGNAEFFAEDVVFQGENRIEVPDGHRMEVRQHNGKIDYQLQPIQSATWHWEYTYNTDSKIIIRKIDLNR